MIIIKNDFYLLDKLIIDFFVYLLSGLNVRILKLSFSPKLNPRQTEPLFATQLTKGGGVWLPPPSDFQNEPPYDAYFGTTG